MIEQDANALAKSPVEGRLLESILKLTARVDNMVICYGLMGATDIKWMNWLTRSVLEGAHIDPQSSSAIRNNSRLHSSSEIRPCSAYQLTADIFGSWVTILIPRFSFRSDHAISSARFYLEC